MLFTKIPNWDGLDQLFQIEPLEEGSPGSLDIGNERRLLEVAVMDFFGPVSVHGIGNAIELGLVDHETRIDRGRIGDDAEPQACGASAIGHRLAHVDDLDSADRAVAGDMPLNPSPH